jgi:hypothetical protein
MGTLFLAVHFIFEVIVFFGAEVCELTTAEYIRTQQVPTMGGNKSVVVIII